MWDVVLDALLDSLKIFAFVFIFNFIFSLFERRKNTKISVFLGATLGLLPQCGFSVIAADEYKRKNISIGTVLAVFIATSDEAIPIILADMSKFYMIFPLLVTKFVIALAIGYLSDLIFKQKSDQPTSFNDNDEGGDCEHLKCGCGCNNSRKNHFVKEHLLHPLIHSLQTFAAVLIFNLIFSFLVYYVGEENINSFIKSNLYFSPLFSVLVGLIPNCASSVIISQLFVNNSISFGACLGGLIANAGVGLSVLFGKDCEIKSNLKVLLILIATALISGYVCCLLFGF